MKHRDKMIVDPFLQKMLIERRNDANIRGIMESVQDRQNEIIYADFETNLVVQGCAGSGKTVILFHRLANMEFSDRDFKIDDVIFISPNDHFKIFISEFAKSLDIRNLTMATFDEYIEGLETEVRIEDLRESNRAESEMSLIKSESQKLRQREYEIRRRYLEKQLDAYLRKYNLAKRRDYASFLRNEKNKKIVKDYDNFVKKMLTGDQEWSEVSEKLKANDERLENLKSKLIERRKYKYIFVDEGQDYSVSQYELLRELNPEAYFNIFGDIRQRLSKSGIREWSELKKVFDFSEYFLPENYRNSSEIIDYIEKRLGEDFGMINMGPSLEEVREIDSNEIKQYYYYEKNIIKSRSIAFIVDTEEHRKMVSEALRDIDPDFANIFTIKEIKGMEFDTVFVLANEERLSKNEIYVSHTRGRNMLYIIKV